MTETQNNLTINLTTKLLNLVVSSQTGLGSTVVFISKAFLKPNPPSP